MPDCRLTHAVTDRDGTLLLDAGTCLTRQDMEASVGGQAGAMATCRLLDYRQVRSDLLGFFAASPYDLFFQ